MLRFFWVLGSCLCVCSAHGFDFVSNGSFESGNTSFSSDYESTSPNIGGLTIAGRYTVDDNPVDNHGSWGAFGDHTSGVGLMYIANGSGVSSLNVWQQTVTGLSIGSIYTFTAWGASAYSVSPAIIRLTVDGTAVDTKALGTTIGSWGKIEGTWVATSTTASLNILDMNTAPDGNDFALDDISFTGPVPEPTTLLAMGTGLVLISRKRRTRRY